MVPDPGNVMRAWEPFDCARECWDKRNNRWHPRHRANRACKRVDLPRVEPDIYIDRLLHYHGRAPDPDLDPAYWPGLGRVRMGSKHPWWQHPPEDWAEGCPGSWYRSPFAVSFGMYHRHRTDNGGRVPNPLLDRADDWLIEEALVYYEHQDERRRAFHEEQRYRAMESKRKAAAQKPRQR